MTSSMNGPLRVGVGGPVGSGKTALMDKLCKALRDRLAVAAVTIPDHVVRRVIPGERICDLTGDPLRCRMVSDA